MKRPPLDNARMTRGYLAMRAKLEEQQIADALARLRARAESRRLLLTAPTRLPAGLSEAELMLGYQQS